MEETIDNVMGFAMPYIDKAVSATEYSVETYGFWPTIFVILAVFAIFSGIISGLSGK